MSISGLTQAAVMEGETTGEAMAAAIDEPVWSIVDWEDRAGDGSEVDWVMAGWGQIQRFPTPRLNGGCRIRKGPVAADD